MSNISLMIKKKCDWGDFVNSAPLQDVFGLVAININAHATLFLTTESIRFLMNHPDISMVFKRDWKYLFQVDEVKNSNTGYDYIKFSEYKYE